MGHLAEPAQVLLDDRKVEAELTAGDRNRLRRGLDPEHGPNRVARDEVEDQEDEDAHKEQHRDRQQEATDDVRRPGCHGPPTRPSPVGSGRVAAASGWRPSTGDNFSAFIVSGPLNARNSHLMAVTLQDRSSWRPATGRGGTGFVASRSIDSEPAHWPGRLPRARAGSSGVVRWRGPKRAVRGGGLRGAVLRGRSFWARFFDLGVFLDGIEQHTRQKRGLHPEQAPAEAGRAGSSALNPGSPASQEAVENFLADL